MKFGALVAGNPCKAVRTLSLVGLCLLSFGASGCRDDDGEEGIADLGAEGFVALGSAVPQVAVRDGELLVFWRGHADKETGPLGGIPLISGDLLRGSWKEVAYWRYDGVDWSGPLRLEDQVEFDGTWGYFRPRLAVDEAGRAHVVWNTQKDPVHVIVADGKIASKSEIPLNPRVARGDDIDVEVLDEGGLLLAYRSEGKDPAARKGGIYVSEFGSGQWGPPSPVGHGAGSAHGDPRLVSHGGRVLMVWRHQAEVRKGGMVATGPTASFSVRNRAGAWSASRLVREIPTDPLAGLDRGPTFYTLYCDSSGKVHMTWGGNRCSM